MKHLIKRRIVQIIGTLLANSYFSAWFGKVQIYQGRLKAIVAPILNCYACPSAVVSCPAGSAQHFFAIHAIPYFVIGTVGAVGVAIGRATCGWICPFGLFQDLIYRLGRLFRLPKISLPRWIGYGRYIFLIGFVILAPYLTATNGDILEPGVTWFCKLCPQGALQGGIPQTLLHPELRQLLGPLFTTKIIILAVFIVMFFLTKRVFCRAVCPVGAFLGIFNEISILKLRVHTLTCNKCKVCYEICPVEHKIFEAPNHPDCIRCGDCISSCPKKSISASNIFSREMIESRVQ